MCFSAPASFAAGALLTPVGVCTLALAWRHDRRYLALAAFPLLFGLQQSVEGGLWLTLTGDARPPPEAHALALGFLFFAYFLWPLLVPLAALQVERKRWRRRLFLLFTLFGGAFGALLYLPLLTGEERLSLDIVRGSILYRPVLLYDLLLSRTAVRVIYALIVAVPLLFTTVPALRLFGLLILASVVGSALFFAYAFVSIWCFIAAVLSLYVLHVVRAACARPPPAGAAAPVPLAGRNATPPARR